MILLCSTKKSVLLVGLLACAVGAFVILNLRTRFVTGSSQVSQNVPTIEVTSSPFHPVVVSCELVREVVVPSVHLVGDRAITFNLIPREDWQYWNRAVGAEIAKYGTDTFNGAVGKIYIVKDLKIGDISVAGTFFGRTVLIAVSLDGWILPDLLIQAAIHHEIAGVLCLWFKQIPRERWSGASDLEYTDADPVDVARQGQLGITSADPRLFEHGFLTQYAKTNPLKDMCSFHERLMMSPEWMQIIADLHPPIKRKLELWLDFLERNEILINRPGFPRQLHSPDRDGGPGK